MCSVQSISLFHIFHKVMKDVNGVKIVHQGSNDNVLEDFERMTILDDRCS